MRASLLELVSHLRDRLGDQPDGKPQRLRESTLQKLRDFLGTFDLRNVLDIKPSMNIVGSDKEVIQL
jgi:hypothetical protein